MNSDIPKLMLRFIKSSEERTDQKIAELQKQIDVLNKHINLQNEEMKYLLDVVGRLGIQITQNK